MSAPDYTLVIKANKEAPGGFILHQLRLSDEAAIAVDVALDGSRDLETIETDDDLTKFQVAETDIEDVLGRLERSRKEIKEPFLNACRLIDGRVAELRTVLEAESARLKAEMSRIYGERRRKELEQKREMEDLAGKARLAALREIDEESAEKMNQLAGRALAAAATSVTSIPGLSIRIGWDAKVVDAVKVVNTNPHLVEVTPRKSAIQNMIKSLQDSGTVIDENTIPGIKLIPRNAVSVRRT
jgi:hypothetical protein